MRKSYYHALIKDLLECAKVRLQDAQERGEATDWYDGQVCGIENCLSSFEHYIDRTKQEELRCASDD